jgi:hypothetical protein
MQGESSASFCVSFMSVMKFDLIHAALQLFRINPEPVLVSLLMIYAHAIPTLVLAHLHFVMLLLFLMLHTHESFFMKIILWFRLSQQVSVWIHLHFIWIFHVLLLQRKRSHFEISFWYSFFVFYLDYVACVVYILLKCKFNDCRFLYEPCLTTTLWMMS